MITFKKALSCFGRRLFRKGNSVATITGYLQGTEMIYRLCGRLENWQDLKAQDVEELIFSNKRRSVGTKAYYAVRVRAFLKFCRSQEWGVINPEQIIIPKTHIKEARFLTRENEKVILRHLEDESFSLKVAVKLMLTTGLRVSEASSLTREALNKAKYLCGVYQIPIQGKGSTTRAIFLTEEVYELCKIRASRHHKQTILGITAGEIQKKIRRFAGKVKIKFTAHTLRHTYLTKLAENGVELYKIQKLAGHKCIITTSRYLHTCDIELAQVVGRLEKFAY